jgi:DNA-binding NtrC family response regulator
MRSSVMAAHPRILLVDDDPALLQALSDTIRLRFTDAVVHTVLSVQDAREQFRRNEYDVVITDLVMPGESGLRLMEELLKVNLTPAVVLISGHLNPSGYGHLGNAFTYLRKPIDRDEFTNSLRKAIRFGIARRRIASNVRRTAALEEQAQQLKELRVAIAEIQEKITAMLDPRPRPTYVGKSV